MQHTMNGTGTAGLRRTILSLLLAGFTCWSAQAQTKPVVAAAAKPVTQPVKAPVTPAAATTPATTPATPAKTAAPATPVIDDLVHTSPTKLVTIHDGANYKKTPLYAKRKQKYDKNEDGSGLKKDVTYPDKSVLHLKMEKNPSYGGQSTSIKSSAKLKSKDKKTESGKQWDCATNDVQLSATSTSFLNNDYSGSASHIYPGAIYTFENFYNGSYKEQTGTRHPMSLVLDNLNASGSSYVTVANPWMGTVNDGCRKLAKELPNKNSATEDFTYQVYETGNSAAQSLQISGGASGYGITASGSYSTASSSNTISLTIDATKIMYTINTVTPDSGYYKSEADEKVPNLMVIGQVSYGIRVLANLTYTFNSASEAADFKASYSSWGVSANVGLDQVSKSSSVSSTINCYVVGGPGNSTISFDKKDLEKQLKSIFSGATYQNAMPISYEFYDMAGDLIGSNSATDHFDVQACVPNTVGGKLQSMYATFTTDPSSGKRGDDHYNFYVYPNDNISNLNGKFNNFNGSDNNITDPSLYSYKTGPLNVDYQGGAANTVQLTANPRFGSYYPPTAQPDVNMDYFVKHGGIVHLHIYPNGSDTWKISKLVLHLNFEGGITKDVTFSNIVVADYSTEATLYFDGTFAPK